ncbi:hypothetical protein J2S08_002546 [Bacillus chungangensis]|uniref:Uncharacterized protein n=1 Tax=Bacillus chungangensis TaxID=587633 RepID=A0ABT9WU88_9BACI|nr:hypothetical protein [Bacillus chungangensis]
MQFFDVKIIHNPFQLLVFVKGLHKFLKNNYCQKTEDSVM